MIRLSKAFKKYIRNIELGAVGVALAAASTATVMDSSCKVKATETERAGLFETISADSSEQDFIFAKAYPLYKAPTVLNSPFMFEITEVNFTNLNIPMVDEGLQIPLVVVLSEVDEISEVADDIRLDEIPDFSVKASAKDTAKDTAKDSAKDSTKDSVKDTAKDTTKASTKEASLLETENSMNSVELGTELVEYATTFVGNPYLWGGTSLTDGADCSGFTMALYANYGIELPHSSSMQATCGVAVDGIENAQIGDLIVYSGHVAVYMGDGQIVHAANSRLGICVSGIDFMNVVGIRRLL